MSILLTIATYLQTGLILPTVVIDFPDWCNPDYVIYGICWPW